MSVTTANVAFGPCPLGQCPHMYMSHDWEEPGVAPMCCVEACGCGKGRMNVPPNVPKVSAPTGLRPDSDANTSEVIHEGP